MFTDVWAIHSKLKKTKYPIHVDFPTSSKKLLFISIGLLGKIPITVTLHLAPYTNHSTFSLTSLSGGNFQFSSVQSLNRVQLSETPWIAARQASLPINSSRSLLKLMPIESVMPSSHLILCHPLLLLLPLPPRIRVFSNEWTPHEVAKLLESQL